MKTSPSGKKSSTFSASWPSSIRSGDSKKKTGTSAKSWPRPVPPPTPPGQELLENKEKIVFLLKDINLKTKQMIRSCRS